MPDSADPMRSPKPHIKPEADPSRQQREPPEHDVPANHEWDAPVSTERDGDREREAKEAVLYYEDDYLR